MTDRPILFSGSMVRAILEGRKTQTRRVLKPSATPILRTMSSEMLEDAELRGWSCIPIDPPKYALIGTRSIPYAPGDRLWVRETFTLTQHGKPVYRADARDQSGARWHSIMPGDPDGEVQWKPSIHMLRWASRLTLTVTDVRIERVQDISKADALAEGIIQDRVIVDVNGAVGVPHEEHADRYWAGTEPDDFDGHEYAEDAFATLWNGIYEARGQGWDANPWVIVLTFTTEQRNIDERASS